METYVNLTQEEKEGIIVFYLEWKLDETNTDDIYKDIYKSVWDFNWKKIILNFDKLEYLNSKAIWYIVDIFSNLEENWWKICISCSEEKIHDILELTWVTEVIPVARSQKEATEMLKSK